MVVASHRCGALPGAVAFGLGLGVQNGQADLGAGAALGEGNREILAMDLAHRVHDLLAPAVAHRDVQVRAFVPHGRALQLADGPAEAGLGRAEHPRGAADRLGNHDGAENFYLSNREHRTFMILHRMDSAC